MREFKGVVHPKMNIPTWSNRKYVPLCTFLQHRYYVPYFTFRGSFNLKCPASGTKTQVQYVTMADLCYIYIGTYGCVFTFTFMNLADAFIQSDLQSIQAIYFFVRMCIPWELNPQPFALLMQCSTIEPQEHFLLCCFRYVLRWFIIKISGDHN